MADEQKQAGQPANPQSEPPKKPAAPEVSATDLLSLWGKPAASPAPTKPSMQPQPTPKPVTQPTPAPKPQSAPAQRPQPPPEPTSLSTTQASLSSTPPASLSSPRQAPKSPQKPAPAPLFSNKPAPAPAAPPSQPKPTPKPAVSFEPAPTPPRPAPAPRPAPEPKPAPKPEPPPIQKPPEAKKVYEGEILSGPKKPPESRAAPHMAAPPPAPNEQEQELLQEKEGFGAQADEFLAELNLSRKHIFYGLGCIVLFVVLVWGGLAGYRYYKNRKTSEAPPPPPSAEISKEQTGIPVSTEVGQPVVVTKEMVGETGIDSTIAVGQTEIIKTEIAYYIMTFRRLQNAYETNIDNLLNQSTDRRAKLRSHLAILKKLHADGTQLLEQMKSQIEKIKQDYEPQRQLQETTDINFFEQLNALNAQTAEDILDKFVEASKQVVALRAKFKALQKVAAFYEEALPKIAARIRDIELNEEALVSGIKIYDVKGSDLKLIVPINNGAVSESERLSSPAFPLIPVNPADIKPTGKDFITQPGGGF